jgi:hypothetical protein
VIKIRYSELQAGLHASATKEGRHTVVHLLPGLSPAERASAIDRLRASARVGHGPKLHAIPLAMALIADRIRQTTRNAAAAARLHPTGVAIPAVVLTSGAILYALLVTVSVNLGLPATSDLAIGPLPVAAAPVGSGNTPSAPAAGRPADPVRESRLTGDQGSGRAGSKAGSGARGKSSPAPSAGPAPSTQPSTGSPTSNPSPSPSLSASTAPGPSPAKGGGGKRRCLNLGLIRLCL